MYHKTFELNFLELLQALLHGPLLEIFNCNKEYLKKIKIVIRHELTERSQIISACLFQEYNGLFAFLERTSNNEQNYKAPVIPSIMPIGKNAK